MRLLDNLAVKIRFVVGYFEESYIVWIGVYEFVPNLYKIKIMNRMAFFS